VSARRFTLRDGSQLVIRRVEIEDAAALLEYTECISGETDFVSFGPGEFGRTLAEEVEFIRARQAAENELFILASIEERIVGLLSFLAGGRPRTRHAGELGMSVCKECWGLGIGSRLLDTLIGWARESGIVTKLNLRVRTDNDRAISLYRHKGFATEGTIRRDFRIGGKYFDHYWMGLEL
jgi:RimJ/RimL family protein N-acetyltransferase